MKFENKYIAIDVETTDVNSSIGEIIQIGAVVINEDCSMGETFQTLVKPMTAHRNPEAMAVNCISAKQLLKAPNATDALAAFEAFAFQVGKRPILAAWASYFDVPFLESLYARAGRKFPFSYKNIDLKAIAVWEAAKHDMRTGDLKVGGGVSGFLQLLGLEFEGTPHDGLDDITNSVRILQRFLEIK